MSRYVHLSTAEIAKLDRATTTYSVSNGQRNISEGMTREAAIKRAQRYAAEYRDDAVVYASDGSEEIVITPLGTEESNH